MNASKTVRLGVVPLLATAFLAGCGSDDEQQTAYCVNAEDEVVDEAECDREYYGGGGGFFFWYFGGGSFTRGQKISSGGERIRASDRAALASKGGFGRTGGSTGGSGRSFGGSGSSGGG